MSDQTLYRTNEPHAEEIHNLIEIGMLKPVEPSLDGMRRAWHTLTPCICGPEYTDRGLESPHCGNHIVDEELLALWRGALEDDDE